MNADSQPQKKRPVHKLSPGTERCNLTSPRVGVMFRDRRLLAWINRFTCNARPQEANDTP